MGDMSTIVLLTTATCLVTGLVGAVVLQVVRRRSVLVSIVVAALVPVAAVSAAVILNVQQMFISGHDSKVVSVALACASGLAVALSLVLGRRVAVGSRQLGLELRSLGTPPGDGGAAFSRGREPGGDRREPLPAEISQLAHELTAARESLHRSQERERALEQSRRELVAFLSHDLRTPLAGLRALTEGLEDGVIEDRPAALRQMSQTVDRMNGLVGDLFELSRLHALSFAGGPETTMVSLVEVGHDVVGELEEHARRRGVTLTLDTADDGDRLAVPGNADELARALGNLVGNALRHTPRHGRVVVSADRAEDGCTRVSVTDGCGGIDEAQLGRVFDVGWQGRPERSSAGAGLGLAIAKGVAEAHAGSISVANVGDGCRFEIALPRAGRRPG